MAETGIPTAMDSRRERTESARLDNFVDGTFAFAITLLVISGANLPRDVAALERALRGVPAFAACFAQLAWFWHAHVRWRDNVRLTDRRGLLLSLLLVFFALIFVFPLHLVYAGGFNAATKGALSPDVAAFTNESAGFAALYTCYGLSYACMAGTLAALFWHGVRVATWIDRREAISVRVSGTIWTYVAAVGLASAILTLTLPRNINGLGGLVFVLLAFIGPVAKRYRKHLEASLPA